MEDPSDSEQHLPLTHLAFEILLALGDEPNHGYAILQDIEERTEGTSRVHPGTLYRAINRLLNEGLLKEMDDDAVPDPDAKRRYALTVLGKDVAAAEIRRLESRLDVARARNLAPRTT